MMPCFQLDFVYKYPGSKVMYSQTCSHSSWEKFRKEAGVPIIAVRRRWTSWAWPGGYPIFHITKDNGILCPKCANKNLQLTLGDDPQWQIVHSEINYEDTSLYCDNCSKPIESAYGEDTDV